MEALEKGVKYAQSWRRFDVFIVNSDHVYTFF